MSPAECVARGWIERAADHCERACRQALDRRTSDVLRADAVDRAEYWSGVAFHESARVVRMQRTYMEVGA